ncbi:pro-sigmaK processing inhibitor BofA family protein [Ornithinibacillus bavariensis]|uniref:Sigma-K factor-processing regulatory protein BofA n=1 Tax=Ornithinibacillus bavariensis TaxID=545502 RepID=A0A919XAR3_9BACI|nr:pro-sigmaK processing inhibitor BofA family protein [Ornithinibacillus bavariensis]GIO28184.1 sigma-K factor-processing regulatory protein BofA [Ornithinibacillus bavariensis]
MEPKVVISIMVAVIVLLLFVGTSFKPLRFLATGTVKLGIGILFLFFFNVLGGSFGLHIPINIFTAVVSGFLGLFGIASLAAIHMIILP